MAINKDLRLFLVDDDIFCLNLYQQFLTKLGYNNVSCYTGGKDCIDHLIERPHIIFLDYNMDEMNGLDVLQAIKAFDKDIAVVFISGQEQVDIAVNALKYGAFDYIVKSKITPELLNDTINRMTATLNIEVKPTKKSFLGKLGFARS